MGTLTSLGSVSEKTRGVSYCGQVYEGTCSNVNGVMYKTFRYVVAPCNWIPC